MGGSLLGWPGLPGYLRDKFPEKDGCDCFLFGGGVLVDVLREWHQTYGFSQRGSHWLAIDMLAIAAKGMALALPEWKLWDAKYPPSGPGKFIIVPAPFCLHDAELNQGTGLEESWNTTSDSIALQMALSWKIDQLVFCKSTANLWGGDWEQAARDGAVDGQFPKLAKKAMGKISICWETPATFA